MLGQKIFITGGAGYLGTNMIKRFYDANNITVYSRDEAKHYYLKKRFPKVKFIVGDIRNYDLLKRATSEGYDLGIFAASLKQIEACYENYEEAEKVIVQGAFNSRRVAEENKFRAACFISSDKSRAATTIYGAMKYVAGESFIANPSSVRLTTAIYGNVVNSTGSIIPLIWQSIANKIPLKLYGNEMTRFLLTVDEAIDLVEKSLLYSGVNTIPIARSFRVVDLFELYKQELGLSYEVTEPRSGEKIHEIMASKEEVRRTLYSPIHKVYLMEPQKLSFTPGRVFTSFPNDEYSSRDCCQTPEQLYVFLKAHNFFKPQ